MEHTTDYLFRRAMDEIEELALNPNLGSGLEEWLAMRFRQASAYAQELTE